MSHMSLDHNLSLWDRVLRGSLGAILIYQGLKRLNSFSPWLVLGGGLVGAPSITGTDPVLKAWGISTRAGDENYFLNLMKQAKPGYGMKPILAEQALPLHLRKNGNLFKDKSLADALIIC